MRERLTATERRDVAWLFDLVRHQMTVEQIAVRDGYPVEVVRKALIVVAKRVGVDVADLRLAL